MSSVTTTSYNNPRAVSSITASSALMQFHSTDSSSSLTSVQLSSTPSLFMSQTLSSVNFKSTSSLTSFQLIKTPQVSVNETHTPNGMLQSPYKQNVSY